MNARPSNDSPLRPPEGPAWRRSWARTRKRLRGYLRLRRLYFVRAEERFLPTEAQRLFLLTLAIGALCGLAAVGFHLTISFAQRMMIERAMSAPGTSWIAWTIVTPVLGALACGALLHYVAPNARGSGIPQVKVAFATQGGQIALGDSLAKFGIGALQLGSGASLGREGPTVHICAGIASALGRVAGVSARNLRRLLPVGAAAGIAAAFNAPIAAVTFTIEEIVGDLDQAVLSGVVVAAALAAVIEHSVLGEHPVLSVPRGYGLHHTSALATCAAIGVAAALASNGFSRLLLSLRAYFARMTALPAWAKPAVGGLVTGLLAAGTLYALGTTGVEGGGYETLTQALDGRLAARAMIVLFAVKLLATAFSYSSGGAGGIFAPVLFIGGMLGGTFGALHATVFVEAGEPVGAFALVGMGALFAGVIRAPITSVLIIVEMTGSYALILPLMIANTAAYMLSRHWSRSSIYEALLEQDGVHLDDHVVMGALEGREIDPLVTRSATLGAAHPGTPAAELAVHVASLPARDVYPVVDDVGCLVGVITADDLRYVSSEPTLLPIANAADLMRPPVWLRPTDDLRTALEAMVEHGVRELPVTDADRRVIGYIDESSIAKAYLHRKRHGERPRDAHAADPGTHPDATPAR